jgi:hypothetical protein
VFVHIERMETNYNDYTVSISNDPSYYGSECSADDAVRISDSIQTLIECRFPGITVRRFSGIGSAGTTGPDMSVIDEIDMWVCENWSAAL